MLKRKRDDITVVQENHDKFIQDKTAYLTDITLKFADNKEIKTHKYLLYEDSTYFADMFKNFDKQVDIKELDLSDKMYISNYEEMKHYITFLYTDLDNTKFNFSIEKLYKIDEYVESKKIPSIPFRCIPREQKLKFMELFLNRIYKSNSYFKHISILVYILEYDIFHNSNDAIITFFVNLTDKAFANYFEHHSNKIIEKQIAYLNKVDNIVEILGESKSKILSLMFKTTYLDNNISTVKFKLDLDFEDLIYMDQLLPNNSSTTFYYSLLLKKLNTNYNQLINKAMQYANKFSDVSLKVGDQIFKAHRIILSNDSTYFSSLLEGFNELFILNEKFTKNTFGRYLEELYIKQFESKSMYFGVNKICTYSYNIIELFKLNEYIESKHLTRIISNRMSEMRHANETIKLFSHIVLDERLMNTTYKLVKTFVTETRYIPTLKKIAHFGDKALALYLSWTDYHIDGFLKDFLNQEIDVLNAFDVNKFNIIMYDILRRNKVYLADETKRETILKKFDMSIAEKYYPFDLNKFKVIENKEKMNDDYNKPELATMSVKQPLFTDVALKVEDEVFNVNRYVLSQDSTYFMELFKNHPNVHEFELNDKFDKITFTSYLEELYMNDQDVNYDAEEYPIINIFELNEYIESKCLREHINDATYISTLVSLFNHLTKSDNLMKKHVKIIKRCLMHIVIKNLTHIYLFDNKALALYLTYLFHQPKPKNIDEFCKLFLEQPIDELLNFDTERYNIIMYKILMYDKLQNNYEQHKRDIIDKFDISIADKYYPMDIHRFFVIDKLNYN